MEESSVYCPKDAFSEKDMSKFVLLCTQKKYFKTLNQNIVQNCSIMSSTPLKVQKIAIDKIKEVIKAKP